MRPNTTSATPTARVPRVRAALAGLAAAVVLGAGLVVPIGPAVADSLEDQRNRTEAEQRATDRAMERLESHLEDTDEQILQTQAELEGIQARIPAAEAELTAAENLLAELQREAALLATRLEDAEALEVSITDQIAEDDARADLTRAAIGQMAREAYKGDMAASSLSAVLGAQDTDQFVEQSAMASTALRTQTHALRELEQINGVNRNRQARLVAIREEITRLKAEVDAKVIEAERARAEAEARRIELDHLLDQQEAKLAQIEAKRSSYLADKAELEQQQARLASDLQEIVRQEREAERKRLEREAAERARQDASRGSGGSGGTAPAPAPPSPGTPGRVLSYPSPMNPPVVTSHYGWRVHPVYGDRRLHAGTDFRAYCGTPIISAGNGTVQWAYYRGGFGNQVMVNHGFHNGSSLMTSYNHLSRFAVSPGQQVTTGQVLGYSGTTGTSTACHLHFEVYVDGATQNPMNFF